MKIGILGGGISGLSIGRLLQKDYKIEILERASIYGGIARTREVEGVAYHTIGGHCFNSKHEEVLEFVFENILPKEEWHSIQRKAVIKLQGHYISYPIEYAINQIHEFDADLALNITKDFLNAEDDQKYQNLEEWFRKKFGDTLAEKYFLPYNQKIWNRDPREMSPDWVEGKLPIPDKASFFKGLLGSQNDKMPHANFYYPNTNNQNTFIDNLAKDLNITYNYDVKQIEWDQPNEKWVINGDKTYDRIISTLPLNIIPKLLKNTPPNIIAAAEKLKFNKVTTMLWETSGTDRTWTYIPESADLFHRQIHIGSFFKPKKNYSITEVVGERSYEEMVANGGKDPFLLRPVSYNVSEHAYVVFDDNYASSTVAVKDYLQEIGVHTLGRFGEWQYYNMDICIKSAIDLFKRIKSDTNSQV